MKRFFRVLISIAGFFILPGILAFLDATLGSLLHVEPAKMIPIWVSVVIYVAASAVSGVFFILVSRRITEDFTGFLKKCEDFAAKQSARAVMFSLGGIALGLFIAYLICTLFDKLNLPLVNVVVSALIYVICGYLGMRITRKSLQRMWKNRETADISGSVKVLDTSAIIDGRIFELCTTGIVEGRILIPEFVLDELRHIADSADALKRAKGRKGLEALQKAREDRKTPIEIVGTDYEDISEVDGKLLKLAEELNGKIITNDFNLNKVAAVKDVPVINLNDISNAVKPILAAGEVLLTEVMKEGKEFSQGVGYLDDGTMIVIENGRKYIGKQIEIVVTSVLQTSAGRMIFAKPKEM